MRIIYLRPPGVGWQCVTHFSILAAELLDAELQTIDWIRANQLPRKLGALIPAWKRGSDKTLVIAPHPEHLLGIVGVRQWLKGSAFTAALVTDSFWTERIPKMLGRAGHYDHVFIHDGEFVDEWQRISGLPVSWVPVGSDVLRFGSSQRERTVDLLRIGRQPDAWNDDDRIITHASEVGLRAGGRPPMYEDVRVGYPSMMEALASSKVTLAFGSGVNPVAYAHPKREMLTYRWADAVASGTLVAGVPPRNQSARELLWSDALVEVSPTDIEAGMRDIKDAVDQWKPADAMDIYRKALRQFDWRWRLLKIAEVMEIDAPKLMLELDEIRARLVVA